MHQHRSETIKSIGKYCFSFKYINIYWGHIHQSIYMFHFTRPHLFRSCLFTADNGAQKNRSMRCDFFMVSPICSPNPLRSNLFNRPNTLNHRTDFREFLFHALVSAIQMINAIHNRRAFRNHTKNDQARRCTQIRRHHHGT